MTHGTKDGTPRKDVAVYIDYENLYISLRSTVGQNPNFDVIVDKCREFGRLTVMRAYADWSEFARVVTSQLFASGVDPVYVPTRKFYDAKTRSQATKNSVDIHITIDIMKDVLLAKNIDCFVLVSGDRDFVPLMNQIRATGREVYAIGVAGCTSGELAVAVDEMFYYHQLLESDEELANEQRDVLAKLVRAIEVARGRGYRATLGVVKPIMRELIVGFDERKVRNAKGVPYQKFKQFVMDAERAGFIRVVESGESVELFLATENPAASRPQAPHAREPRETRTSGSRPERPQPRHASSSDDQDHAGSVAAAVDGDHQSSSASSADGESVAADGAEPAEDGAAGRRRGRRGGRGRGRRGPRSADEMTDAASLSGEGGDEDPMPDIADDSHRIDGRSEVSASGNGDGASWDEPAPAAPPRARAESDSRGSRDARAFARASAQQVTREAESDDDDTDADDEADLAGLTDLTLPDAAYDDLKTVMDTFDGRAPSQRRLIARLKKGATTGELRGEYKEGQFLLLVRKAIQDGHLEKVSKGFYAGLRWNEQSATSPSA